MKCDILFITTKTLKNRLKLFDYNLLQICRKTKNIVNHNQLQLQ